MQGKNKINKNGLKNGYWEKQNHDGSVLYICNFIDGIWRGYFEQYNFQKIIKEYAAR